MSSICPLCSSEKTQRLFEAKASKRLRTFYRCECCHLVFVPKEFHLSFEEEKRQYELHENHIENAGYLQLLQPAVDWVVENVGLNQSLLDYGSGPNPVLAGLLKKQGYSAKTYDPYFASSEENSSQVFDLVTCTEVVEHFCSPIKEWEKLLEKVKSGGSLVVLTQWHSLAHDLRSWHYIRDITHVSFYCEKTFAWLADFFSCDVKFERGLAIFRKSCDSKS